MRALRLAVLDERFDRMPHSVVRTLQEMLRDGRIERWERDHVLRIVDADASLTAAERRRVRDMVEGWAALDSEAR